MFLVFACVTELFFLNVPLRECIWSNDCHSILMQGLFIYYIFIGKLVWIKPIQFNRLLKLNQ